MVYEMHDEAKQQRISEANKKQQKSNEIKQ